MKKKGDYFKTVAVSDNTNSFGLKQGVFVSKGGVVFKACANYLNMPKQGEDIFVPYTDDYSKKHNFSAKGFEIPEKMDNAPLAMVKEIWGKEMEEA